jgi:hypothetical protein
VREGTLNVLSGHKEGGVCVEICRALSIHVTRVRVNMHGSVICGKIILFFRQTWVTCFQLCFVLIDTPNVYSVSNQRNYRTQLELPREERRVVPR